ncbi:DUF4199 domain-containing protein [Cesiribacter andamanensis]|uniref:DUF4199 domain-containing protein n=1 Tax=Cesiribacter andamanensis AMV16 TaxID=1279009 RepID=M7NBL0_9BACT|nr:DUF4199 domain-containing protein [Cesiribacter andamanensis]EMR04576.1 hypothetical protein ADICEAN_00334 [Cesiribacter andamanensis AMV16]
MKAASVSAEQEVSPLPKKPLFTTGLKYGLAGGGISIGLFLSLWLLKENPLDSLRLFDFILIPLFVFFTLKEVRDYHYRGRLHYWQGMTAGFVCYASLAAVSAIFIYIFLSFADTDLLMRHQNENLAVLMEDPEKWIGQVGKQAYEQALEEVRNLTAADLALDDFLKKTLIGLFITGIITLFYKK